MKKIFIGLFIGIILLTACTNKVEKDTEFNKGSKINNIELNEQRIENLQILGLVWGYLKYYHPDIAKGNYNWDFELFRILPKINNAKNSSERDVILQQWIDSLGKCKINKKQETKEDVKMQADLSWINNYPLSDNLKNQLNNLSNAKRSGKNYYIDFDKQIGNPLFDTEDKYENMEYPDAGFRLLSLFRYWNIIQYYYPYKYLIEEDWKGVLKEFIPKFIDAKNKTEYRLAIAELTARICDSHGGLWDNTLLYDYWGKNIVPVQIKFIDDKAIVEKYINADLFKECPLNVGDEITKINGKLVSDIVSEQLKYMSASNYPTKLRNFSWKLLRTNDSILNLEITNKGTSKTKQVKTYDYKEVISAEKDTTNYFKQINKDIAYLYLGTIKAKYLQKVFEDIKDTKGLIIDLRCYPAEFVVFKLGAYLMPNFKAFARFTNANPRTPGEFIFSNKVYVGARDYKDYYKGKVVILVNEQTQSQAEYTAMACRVAPKSTVIGSTTSGADGNVSFFYLPGGIKTAITGIGVYYPNKTETQRVGIVPDIEVKPTINGIQNHKDEVLEKAIEVINN